MRDHPPYLPPPDTGLDIVHVDAALLVVNKPSGLLSVPGRGVGKENCLASRVQAVFPEALIVHRLDMETSGLMVMARSPEVHRQLSIAFQQRLVEKRYLALVAGKLAKSSGVIDLPLISDWPNRPLQKVDHETGKPSLTRFCVQAYDADTDVSCVALEPETGRTHQLRVHLQAIGHPILGDVLYAPPAVQAKSCRLLLHADHLCFSHPVSSERLLLSSSAPF